MNGVRSNEPMSRSTHRGAWAAPPTRTTVPESLDSPARFPRRRRSRRRAGLLHGPRQQPAGARRRYSRHRHQPGEGARRRRAARRAPRTGRRGRRVHRPGPALRGLGLGPSDFFAGIPGTVGGALKMNAGAFGGETWDSVTDVDTIDRAATIRTRPKADFEISIAMSTDRPTNGLLRRASTSNRARRTRWTGSRR